MSSALIISCLSQKGGVGKSTITRLIARTYAAANWKVKIADINTKQKTSVDWAALRLEQGIEPEIAAEAFNSVKVALKQTYDLMVFDGRPDSDTSTLDCARESHLIVIPTGATLDDLRPQVLFAHELQSRGITNNKILFVLNKTPESLVAVQDAAHYIRSAGYAVVSLDLPMKVGYQNAQNTGRAASETSFPSLNERADSVAAEIVRVANQLAGF